MEALSGVRGQRRRRAGDPQHDRLDPRGVRGRCAPRDETQLSPPGPAGYSAGYAIDGGRLCGTRQGTPYAGGVRRSLRHGGLQRARAAGTLHRGLRPRVDRRAQRNPQAKATRQPDQAPVAGPGLAGSAGQPEPQTGRWRGGLVCTCHGQPPQEGRPAHPLPARRAHQRRGLALVDHRTGHWRAQG